MFNHQLVEEIVKEVLRRMEIIDKHEKPQLLVIHRSTETSKLQVEELKNYWRIKEICSNDLDLHLSPAIQQAVFLEVNQDLLVKGALGLVDTHESLLFSQLMIRGLKVDFILDETLSFALNVNVDKHENKNYIQQLLEYQTQLREFGVNVGSLKSILPIKNNDESMPPLIKEPYDYAEKLLTKKIIESWEKAHIRVHPTTIITPLARDVARERGIEIVAIEPKMEG